MEATCADIAKVFDSRALFVMQRLGEPPRVETVDFMDRMQLGMQKRSSVLNGDFSCCRMGHQVTAAGSGEKVAIPCDKDRLREVLTDLLHRQTGRLRSIWEARLDSLPSDTSARNFESMMGADGGAWFKFLVMTFLEQNILSEVPKEAWEEASDLWWVAKGWVSDGVASDAQVAEFNRLFGYEMPGPDADAETLERHLNGWVWQQGMFGNVPLLRHLVEVRGGDVTHVNRHGMTALKLAATFGQLPMIRYICEYTKGDLAHLNHISSGLGLTSLGCAAKCGHFQCCQELLRHGASTAVKRHDNGMSPLLEAAAKGHKSCCEVLLAAGADPTAVDKDGRTASGLAGSLQAPDEHLIALLEDAANKYRSTAESADTQGNA